MLAALLSLSLHLGSQEPPMEPIAKGPFIGSLESLRKNRFPKWFTEGKLGIWAHWGPQAVPMEGDWYARQMYEEGSKDYNDHLERWGHPSEHGYKDLIPLWKAEKWDPDRLMSLYKAAGAKYFVSMGVHHDNFDLWNSTHHRWNAVKMGPHRDVVGDWQKAAKKQGLRFGVSEHLGASWTWFQKSRGADKAGPLAGKPYDGNDPANEDLYHPKALPGDDGWYTKDPRWHQEWYRRVKDLVDQYKPDLLYTDGGLPFGKVGESLVAHFYNVSIRGGKQEGVYNCKQASEGRWAQDVERGVMAGIQPYPWQIDTSIGDWYYNKNWKFRGADWVIHTLVDVVSKNGNLLVNVVQRPDGSLDPEAEKVLADMAAWMKVNSESIYGTKPWLVFGEGPTRAKGGAFKEDFGFSAKDVRYAQKGDGLLYATLLGAPESPEITLASLSKGPNDTAEIRSVQLLGSKGSLPFTWDEKGLQVSLPDVPLSEIAVVLKISGRRMREFQSIPDPFPKPPVPTVTRSASGTYELKAELAELPDDGIQLEAKDGNPNLGYWDNPLTGASWNVDFQEAGIYEVVGSFAGPGQSSLNVEIGSAKKTVVIEPTGDFAKFQEVKIGELKVGKAGKTKVMARPTSSQSWRPLNLRYLVFKRVQ